MTIPNVIHQSMPTAELPDWCRPLRDRVRALHPLWEHRFYDDDCRELIRQEMPCLLAVYDAYPTTIQRIDLFRIPAVYAGGGFYLDSMSSAGSRSTGCAITAV